MTAPEIIRGRARWFLAQRREGCIKFVRRCRRRARMISGQALVGETCITMSSLCVFPHTFYAAIFLFSVKFRVFRGYKMTRGLIACGVTNHKNSEPRNTRNFTDETAPHTVSFLTRKPHRPLPLYACCDFAFFLCSAGYFFRVFVSSCEICSAGGHLDTPRKSGCGRSLL
jgi:hypothetical protein